MPLLVARLAPVIVIAVIIIVLVFVPRSVKEAFKRKQIDRTRASFVMIIAIVGVIVALWYILIYSTY